MADNRSVLEREEESPTQEPTQNVWPFQTAQERNGEDRTVSFPVDICETEEKFVIVGEMPGLTKKQINIRVSDDELTISGRLQLELDDEERVTHREILGREYRRTFTLSDAVDREKIEAGFRNGVLTVELAKSESVKPRQIEING